MNKQGEIVIVDDDIEDSDLIIEAFKELGFENKVICFQKAPDVLEYLRKIDSDPFFIIADLRMPIINGLELRQMIYTDENLIQKAVPFVLYSTAVSSSAFNMALTVGVQGFLIKPASFEQLRERLRLVYNYMNECFGN